MHTHIYIFIRNVRHIFTSDTSERQSTDRSKCIEILGFWGRKVYNIFKVGFKYLCTLETLVYCSICSLD